MMAGNAFEIIKPHPTWEIVDPSKLTTFMECPRKFFYRYMLGWVSTLPKNDLIFGSAWHVAVEHLLRNGYDAKSLEEAKFMFENYYRRELSAETDHLYPPKTPADAFEALDLYVDTFRDDLSRYSVEYTEIAGLVLIGEDATLHFKMDAILREKDTGLYFVMDHKTSKLKKKDWATSWNISTQLLTYLHALYCLHSPAEVRGARVRGSFFYKAQSHKFDEAFIDKNPDQMQAWLGDTEYWYGGLQFEMERMADCSDSHYTMECFPRNDTSCNNWGGCTYAAVCDAWPNPLQKVGKFLPENIKVEFWDPREIPTIRERIDFTVPVAEGVESDVYGPGSTNERRNSGTPEENRAAARGTERVVTGDSGNAGAIPTSGSTGGGPKLG